MQVKTGDRLGVPAVWSQMQRGSLPLPVSNSDHEGRFPGNIEKNLASVWYRTSTSAKFSSQTLDCPRFDCSWTALFGSGRGHSNLSGWKSLLAAGYRCGGVLQTEAVQLCSSEEIAELSTTAAPSCGRSRASMVRFRRFWVMPVKRRPPK